MKLWTKMHRAGERVKIKRELRKRNIPFKINKSTRSLNLKKREREQENKEDRCKEINLLDVEN